MSRRFAWVALALLVAYLIFIGGGWAGIYFSLVRTLSVALAAVGLGVWLLVAWRRPAWRPRSVLLPALLACLASLAISTVFSREPRVSLEYLGYGVVSVALYLFLVRVLADPFLRQRMLGLGAMFFVILVIEFVGGVIWLWVDWLGIVGHVTQPPLRPYFIGLSYGNPSAVLTMVTLLGIPTAALAARSRWRVVQLAGIGIAIAGVAVLSGSRAGWLALAVAGGVGLVGGVAAPQGRAAVRRNLDHLRRVVPRALQIAAAATAVATIGAVIVLLPAILRRIDAGGEDLRTTFAVVALRLFAQSPIVGTGPGTWVIERIAATRASEIDYYIPHAHDVPVQTLAELGIVGAIVGAFLIGSVFRLLLRAFRDPRGEVAWLAWLTTIGAVYLGVHDLLDFYPNMPAVLFAIALPVAYLDATRVPTTPSLIGPALWPRARGLVGALALCVALVGLLAKEGPALLQEDAVRQANDGDWANAGTLADAAAAEDPAIHPYDLTAGLAAVRSGDFTSAASYFRVVAEDDDLPEAWLDLASAEIGLGNRQAALDALAKGMRLGRQRVAIAMAAGEAYRSLGDQEDAVDAFATALVQRPSLAADPWWQTTERRDLFPVVLSRMRASAGSDGRWEVALVMGDVETAHALVASTSSPELTAVITAAWAEDPETTRQMYAQCDANPLDLGPLLWCARVADHLGDGARADRFRAIAEGVSPGSSEQGSELRVQPSGLGDAPTTTTALYWGQYTYLRATPADLLSPTLIHLIRV
jgi:O-antigen ligase